MIKFSHGRTTPHNRKMDAKRFPNIKNIVQLAETSGFPVFETNLYIQSGLVREPKASSTSSLSIKKQLKQIKRARRMVVRSALLGEPVYKPVTITDLHLQRLLDSTTTCCCFACKPIGFNNIGFQPYFNLDISEASSS